MEGLCKEVAHSWQRALKAIEAQKRLEEELQHARACRAAADSACLQLHARVQELEGQVLLLLRVLGTLLSSAGQQLFT